MISRWTILFSLFGLLLAACVVPPTSQVVYSVWSDYFPPARAVKMVSLLDGAAGTAAVGAALDLGVFEVLAARGPLTPGELAAAVSSSERGVRILGDVLVVFDVLKMVDGGHKYALGPAARRHLVRGSDEFFGGFFQVQVDMFARLGSLAAAVRRGGTVAGGDDNAETDSHRFWLRFANVTGESSRTNARLLAATSTAWAAKRTNGTTAAPIKVLDVAAGSGVYGFEFARAVPNAHITFLDYANVLDETRANHPRLAPDVDAARLTYRPANFFADADAQLGGPYDVIMISQFFHHFNESGCEAIARRAVAALAPGGRILVNDFLHHDGHPGLFDSSITPDGTSYGFSMMMLMWSHGGEAYTPSAYRRFFAAAGIADVTFQGNFPYPFSFVIADKSN